jgi:lipopolysaccharide transport system ATP-binding protein
MGDSIIKVQGLSKKFIIGHQPTERYVALRDKISGSVKGAIDKAKSLKSGNYSGAREIKEEFWALKDINFEIRQGDRVGIVGRNGAGKSTLLKILSRITEPTTGRISIKGRIASLLEVGTGFHPELTGRENIFLNGAILGMNRNEIKRKFDAIVDFAEVETFLDTPVKRYSSGMYVRLAFAVAAHLEPEILVVDEVLAVGDVQFQQKCLGKMEDVSKNEGRTVLFVSHNMSAIKSLCETGIFLFKGKVARTGTISEVLEDYMETSFFKVDENFTPVVDPAVNINKFYLSNDESDRMELFRTSEDIFVNIEAEIFAETSRLRIGFDLLNSKKEVLFRSFDDDTDYVERRKGVQLLTARLPANLLKQDEYFISLQVGIHDERWVSNETSYLKLRVEHVDGVNKNYKDYRPGLIMPMINWNTNNTK